MLVLGRSQQLAVGHDDVDRKEVVDREAVFAHQPADTAAEREPGHSGVAHDSAGGGETVRLRFVVDVAPERPTLHPCPAPGGIDLHGPHRREVDDDAVIANGRARHVVASAPYRDLEIVVVGELYGRNHVGRAAAAGDQARTSIDRTVPDCTGDVVIAVRRADQAAPEPVDFRDAWLHALMAGF
jgi:hypothetical protein